MHKVFKVLKATLVKYLYLILCDIFQISEIVFEYLALPNQSLGFEMFSALRLHLRGN